MITTRTIPLLPLAAALAACAPEVPAEPTWAEHVKPILDANCVRCHGAPAIGGAPPGFRLDRYEDTPAARGGELIQGAGAMAQYVAERVADGTMPPDGRLDAWQIETLVRWWELAPERTDRTEVLEPPPRGRPAPGNTPPSIEVVARDDAPASAVLLDYLIRDPDRETVTGELRVGPTFETAQLVDRSLHEGRGTAGFGTAAFAAAEVRVFAVLRDGSIEAIADLGTFDTRHGPDLPPRVVVFAPAPFEILHDRDAPAITFQVLDLDSPGPFTARITATPDPSDARAEPIEIARDVPVPLGEGVTVPWDTTGLPETETWQVTITVTDGAGSSGGASIGRLIVSHATTTETFASIQDVLAKCTLCHGDYPPGSFPGNPYDFARYDGSATLLGVHPARALVYQRAVKQQNMPPRSIIHKNPRIDAGLTPTERARLAAWLLAGAPEE